jgi:hypothetical protein
MYQGKNLYSVADRPFTEQMVAPQVFLSHRQFDKPKVRALARLLSALDIHYWLDEEDQDIRNAVALGLIGESAVVHAIERGVNHCSILLGLLTSHTQGSWWVPYEIGYCRAAAKPASFVAVRPAEIATPEFVRVAAVYWSVDEIARWASTLAGHDLHTDLSNVDETIYQGLAQYLPLDPPAPELAFLCNRALQAIDLLKRSEVQLELELTTNTFSWLPTRGGLVREIAYDIMAPLAYHQLDFPISQKSKSALIDAYLALTEHCAIAKMDPPINYDPECTDWRIQRYITPDRSWLQGLRPAQLFERLSAFLTARDRRGCVRLATREEFKAEFDRVLNSGNEHAQRSLGVFLNPLFGFTPASRPVYNRILSIWRSLYSNIVNDYGHDTFDRQMAL